MSGSERLRVQLEAKVASEALMRRQLVELSAWLRTLPPRVGSALAKPATDQGGAGAQGGLDRQRRQWLVAGLGRLIVAAAGPIGWVGSGLVEQA